jgi:hypothetical protein
MKYRIYVIVMCIAVAITACNPFGSDDGLTVESHWPLSVGNKWNFVTKEVGKPDGSTMSVEIIASTGRWYRLTITEYDVVTDVTSADTMSIGYDDGEIIIQVRVGDGNPWVPLSEPIKQSSNWASFPYGGTADRERTRIVSTDSTYSLPAGTFENVIVTTEYDTESDVTGDLMGDVMCYAPGVGLVCTMYYQYDNDLGTFVRVKRKELVSYVVN